MHKIMFSCVATSSNIRAASTYTIRTRNQNVIKFLRRQIDDEYVKLARTHNYRARSAFKLIEINEKLRLFKPGTFLFI